MWLRILACHAQWGASQANLEVTRMSPMELDRAGHPSTYSVPLHRLMPLYHSKATSARLRLKMTTRVRLCSRKERTLPNERVNNVVLRFCLILPCHDPSRFNQLTFCTSVLPRPLPSENPLEALAGAQLRFGRGMALHVAPFSHSGVLPPWRDPPSFKSMVPSFAGVLFFHKPPCCFELGGFSFP